MEKVLFGEVEAKAVLCEHLSKKLGSRMLTMISELPVFCKATRADLVVDADGLLHAYEIKSAKDGLERLARQVQSLGESFDTVTVVVDERHLELVRGLVRPPVGIWVLAHDQVLELRKARRQKVSKLTRLGMMSRAGLIKLAGRDSSTHNFSRPQLESRASKVAKSAIEAQLRSELQKRYKSTYSRFLVALARGTNPNGIVEALSPNLNKKMGRNTLRDFEESSLASWQRLFPPSDFEIQSTQSSSSTTNAASLLE